MDAQQTMPSDPVGDGIQHPTVLVNENPFSGSINTGKCLTVNAKVMIKFIMIIMDPVH